jgi:hypothetical protein
MRPRRASGFFLLFVLALSRPGLAAPAPTSTPPPGPPKEEALLNDGELLERAGRLEEAEGEYRKALESDSAEVRAAAVERLRKVIVKRKSWQEHSRQSVLWTLEKLAGFAAPAGVIAVLVALLILLRRYGRIGLLGWNRLEVQPLTTSGDGWLGEHFRDLVRALRHGMGNRSPNAMTAWATDDSKLPLLNPDWGEEVGDLATEIVPGGTGKLAAWLLARLSRPEYTLSGSLQVVDTAGHLVVRLERANRIVRVWETTRPTSDLIETMKDFAYEALIAMQAGEGRPHAH